jgi:hypothetical protein
MYTRRSVRHSAAIELVVGDRAGAAHVERARDANVERAGRAVHLVTKPRLRRHLVVGVADAVVRILRAALGFAAELERDTITEPPAARQLGDVALAKATAARRSEIEVFVGAEQVAMRDARTDVETVPGLELERRHHAERARVVPEQPLGAIDELIALDRPRTTFDGRHRDGDRDARDEQQAPRHPARRCRIRRSRRCGRSRRPRRVRLGHRRPWVRRRRMPPTRRGP